MNPFPTHIYSGPSMIPLFRPGDSLRLEDVAFEQLSPGDVIVFRPSGREGQDAEGTGSTVPVRPGTGATLWPPSATERHSAMAISKPW